MGEAGGGFRTEFGERLRWLMDLYDTRPDAARVAGVVAEHLPSYLSGKTKPPFELVVRLAAAKKVSLEWLASGMGDRFQDGSEEDGFAAIPMQPDAESRLDGEAEPALLFARAFLEQTTDAPIERLRIVVQRGNAHEPVIRDGDALLVDTSVDKIADDALYVFVRDGRYLARFVETFADGRVALKSRNPEYGMQTLSRDEAERLQVLGRVRWRGGPI